MSSISFVAKDGDYPIIGYQAHGLTVIAAIPLIAVNGNAHAHKYVVLCERDHDKCYISYFASFNPEKTKEEGPWTFDWGHYNMAPAHREETREEKIIRLRHATSVMYGRWNDWGTE